MHTNIHTYIHTYGLFHYALRGAQVLRNSAPFFLTLHSPNLGTAGMLYLYIFYLCMCVCMHMYVLQKCTFISSLYMFSIVKSSTQL